jgi:TRAP-type C4-dicarboxylate transport system permease small subunit
MRIWIKRLHLVEDALLVTLLTMMIVLASTQILLRNFFDSGIVWIDPLLRVLVLWLGLLGATVATRNNKHISIDLLSRFLKRKSYCLVQSGVAQISAWTCLVIAWYGLSWIRLDYEDALASFVGIPAWMLEVVIPAAFALIGLRYLVKSVFWVKQCIRHQKVEESTAE